jgi:uncharacterized membrane protein
MIVFGKKSGCLAIAVLIAYVVFGWLLARHSEGLITPDQSVSLSALVLGIGTLTLRLVLLFIVLPTSVYRIVLELGRHIAEKWR